MAETVGSSPGYSRPVLVIQSDRFNQSKINTVVIAVITKDTDLINSEGNVLITKQQSKLPCDAVINVSQLFTIDESQLRYYISSLSEKKMRQVDLGLRKVLSL